MSEVAYWIGFNLISGIGRVKFGLLRKHFGNLEQAWNADSAELQSAGLDSKSIQAIARQRPTIDLEAELSKLDQHEVKALIIDDPAYPSRLKEIYDPPPVLFVRGSLDKIEACPLAVVGSRRASHYGREVTEQLVSDLVRNNMVIISGLARGIDTVAHRIALNNGGQTFAVMACGLDIVYPPENRRMAQEITENGALLSEYPLGIKPRADNFPRRNRIMSGLSLGTLVIEAAERSGALITARMALEQDREVFAVPGSILTPSGKGSNYLLRDGAKLVLEVEDILEELNLNIIPHQIELCESLPANETELILMDILSDGAIHIDEICRATNLSISIVSSTLTMMELKGMVNQLGGMNYVAARGVRTK